MSFTSNEKSYGGYSSFSPMRHAERSSENTERNENVPAYVHDKVEEIMEKQKEKDESQAWAVAWSIYCKYKKPNSPHCKKEKDEYFPNQNKKATQTREEVRHIKRVSSKISKALDKITKVGLIHISKLIKEHTNDDLEEQLTYYLWTHGKFPSFLLDYGVEARILGQIASDIHYEKKPSEATRQQERNAYRALAKVIKYCHVSWGSKVWAKVWFLSEEVSFSAIRLEMVNRSSNITHGVQYTRLIRHLFK